MLSCSLLFTIAGLTGCSSTALTKSQRSVLLDHVDLVADAIHLSIVRSQQPLYQFHRQHGEWPTNERDKAAFVEAAGTSLTKHGVENLKLLSIDNEEILIEFYFSRNRTLQIPPLIESWIVIFSGRSGQKLEVVSVYPNWCEPAELARQTAYDAEIIARLQMEFRRQLAEKLKAYEVKLNETINESV
ncbi:MAG: hypothetical protein PVF34_05505 [Gammaproteobacteria bacterium]